MWSLHYLLWPAAVIGSDGWLNCSQRWATQSGVKAADPSLATEALTVEKDKYERRTEEYNTEKMHCFGVVGKLHFTFIHLSLVENELLYSADK